MKKKAMILMILTIMTKVLGFARDITLSYFYGSSKTTDVYLISQSIPAILVETIGMGLLVGYIPVYSKIDQTYGKEAAARFNNNLINITLVVTSVVVLLGLTFTDFLVKIFALGFDGETLQLAVKFTKISLLEIYLYALVCIFAGFLQVKGNYFAQQITGFPLNILTITAILVSVNTSIMILPIGDVIAIAAQLVILAVFAFRAGFRYKFIFDIRDKHVKNLAYMALPLILGVSVNQINLLVDRTLASQIIVGGISALNYANRLNAFIQGTFVLSISTIMYPTISKFVAENNILELKRTLAESISIINLFVIPISVGAMFFAEPIIKLLLGRGAFDAHAVSMTSKALFFYSFGMIGFGLREVLSRTFYSLQDAKTPTSNAVIALVVNIVLSIMLSRIIGISGLALATSFSAILCSGLLLISLRKKMGSFGMKNITISFLKILFASLIMGLITWAAYIELLHYISDNLSLIASIGIGALVYFLMLYFMKIKDVEVIINAIKRGMNKS